MDDQEWRAPGREHAAGGPPAGAPPQGRPTPARPDDASPWPGNAPSRSSDAFVTTERHRGRAPQGAGDTTPAYRNEPVAVAAVILGALGILVPGLCLVAVALGHLALHRLRTSYDGGRGLAVAGLVLGYAMTAVWLGVLLLVLAL